MSLMNCPECGSRVSDKAPSCPTCGCPIKESYDVESIAQSVSTQLEKCRLEQAAGFYRNANAATRANISSYTDFDVDELSKAKGVISKNAQTDAVLQALNKAQVNFSSLDDGEEKYKRLVFAMIKIAFDPKYHTRRVGIFNCYDSVYLLDMIGLDGLSAEEIIEIARIAMKGIDSNDELRGTAFRHFRARLPEGYLPKLLDAFNVFSEIELPDEPFFEEAMVEWKDCKASNRKFNYLKYIDLNAAAKKVGKENAESYVRDKERAAEQELESTRAAELIVRAGNASNGKAPACCPSCSSIHGWKKVATGSSGVSAGKAVAGAAVAGTAGGIVGASMGKKMDTYRCSECGFTHEYPHSSENKSGTEALEAQKRRMEHNMSQVEGGQADSFWNTAAGNNIAIIGGGTLLCILLFGLAACINSCAG